MIGLGAAGALAAAGRRSSASAWVAAVSFTRNPGAIGARLLSAFSCQVIQGVIHDREVIHDAGAS